MTVQEALRALILSACPRVYPDKAPPEVTLPYVVYFKVGGRPLRWLDNTAADKRHGVFQFTTWAATRKESVLLAKQIEDLLSAATTMNVTPDDEPTDVTDDETDYRGAIQTFTVFSPRSWTS